MTDTRGIDEQVNTAIRGMEGKMTVEAGEAGEDKEEIRPVVAAAPDMLRALEEVVAITENLPVCPFCGAVKAIQSHRPDCLSHEIETAIRKARGEE